ncbi:MAG TPA: translation initiation factor IF-2 [Longimicrobiales bacterium]|nr:translation initiation factor IF-2 [Longimicrobiales bacterium]
MRVFEVAKEFNVPADTMIQLLREMGQTARSEASKVDDAVVAKLRARFERQRRSGSTEAGEVVEAVLEDAHTTTRRRRRRRRTDEREPDEEAAEVVETEDVDEAVAEAEPEGVTEEAAGAEVEAPVAEAEEARPEAEPEEEPDEIEAVAEMEPEAEVAGEPEAGEDEEAVEAVEAPAAERTKKAPKGKAAAEALPEADADADAAAEEEKKEKVKRRPRRVSESLPGLAPAASAGPSGKVRIQAEGYTADGQRKRADKKKKRRARVDQEAVQENVQRVMAELKGGGSGRKRRRSRQDAETRQVEQEERERVAAEEAKTVRVNEFLTVAELAELMDEDATQIISSAFKNLGLMVTMNQRLDFDQIELLLDEFGFKAVREEEYGTELPEAEVVEDAPEDLKPRPPVVTVMGHVDHGKTSLLDYIRKANVIAGESGGITQHIGAYHVTLDDGRSLSFLDTPGHAAFTAMRARGAEVTDVVILVVAADDAVMPQTIEAISHARSAGVPIIVAINKVDLPGANPEKVKQELLEHNVVVEEYGGEVLAQPVSAKTGEGVDDLLEKVLLQAELLEVTANPDRDAQGVVIEAQIDVGKGAVATVLVTNGTLRVGDDFVCGMFGGRVRALLDERGHAVEEAGPAIPVQVLGINGVPQAGDKLVAMEQERATEIVQTRQRLEREKKLRVQGRGVKLTDISRLLAQGETAQLNVVIKGDVDGSVQALADSLEQLSTEEVAVEVVHRGVGAINKSDALLAATAGGIIIGFHVRPDAEARSIAEQEDVDIRVYDVIYEAIADVRAALEGMLTPDEKEVLLGAAEVRQIFKVPRAGTVAGCYVTEGVIRRGEKVRLVRDGVQVYQGQLGSLKRFKDDVREVREGFECGLSIEGFNDIKPDDVVECFTIEEIARTLAGAAGQQG